MDLDHEIQLIIPKDKIVGPEERHKRKIPELPPVSIGNNRNLPVSIQELVYGHKAAGVGTYAKSLDRNNELIYSSEEVNGPRKDRGLSEGLDTHVLQRTSPTDKSLVEKPKHVQKSASTSAKKGQENPKEQSEGKEKVKGKVKFQVEQALPTELQNSQEREDSHGQCVQYGKNSDGVQKQGGGKNEPLLSKGIDLVKPMSWFIKQKDRLTAVHPDISEEMIHKRILRKCGGDLENAIRRRYIEPCSTEYYINAMEDITTRT
ncbi:hypothetical protein O181_081106 [Austropuccinia psidii MF-1]|uniref:Uncharacterized protein n=1 Tax=Austropuccinia psidii MF-1 TaxID=1389203 RepID=A0A9Q3IFL4_9BASI|nr:hypothetical protein [Austropuccinia psidii MF-1]